MNDRIIAKAGDSSPDLAQEKNSINIKYGEGFRFFNKMCLMLYGISFIFASPIAIDLTGFLRFSKGTAPALLALFLHLLQGSLALINILLLREQTRN